MVSGLSRPDQIRLLLHLNTPSSVADIHHNLHRLISASDQLLRLTATWNSSEEYKDRLSYREYGEVV